MARKRKKSELRVLEVRFVDGPKDGDEARMASPPPLRVRYAWPEWATYEFHPPNIMKHIGDVRLPLGKDQMTVEYWKGPLD